jgi:hypothetical protein
MLAIERFQPAGLLSAAGLGLEIGAPSFALILRR